MRRRSIDLDRPPSEDDFVYTRALKRFSVYFNSRYQTYGRHVHMWAFYGNYTTAVVGSGRLPGGLPSAGRGADASRSSIRSPSSRSTTGARWTRTPKRSRRRAS